MYNKKKYKQQKKKQGEIKKKLNDTYDIIHKKKTKLHVLRCTVEQQHLGIEPPLKKRKPPHLK